MPDESPAVGAKATPAAPPDPASALPAEPPLAVREGPSAGTAWALIVLGLLVWSLQPVIMVAQDACLPAGELSLAGSATAATNLLAVSPPDPPLCPFGGSEDFGSRAEGSVRVIERIIPAQVEDAARAHERAVVASWPFTIGSTLFVLGVFLWGWRCLYSQRARRRSWWLGWATLALGIVDAVENVALQAGLQDGEIGASWVFRVAAGAAVTKYALALPVFIGAGYVAATLAGRWVVDRRSRKRPKETKAAVVSVEDLTGLTPEEPLIIIPGRNPWLGDPRPKPRANTDEADGSAEDTRRWRNAAPKLPGRDHGEVGIVLSGGGIRSGTVALGALQQWRRESLTKAKGSILGGARYLVSVSGGGYIAGAFQLALNPLPSPPTPPRRTRWWREPDQRQSRWVWQNTKAFEHLDASAESVFAPGSVEEDHVRRNANYIADNARDWATALAVLLRGVLVSLTFITLTVIVLGQFLTIVYAVAPVESLEALRPGYLRGQLCPKGAENASLWQCRPEFPALDTSTQWVLALLALLAAIVGGAYILCLGGPDRQWERRQDIREMSVPVVWALLIVFGYAVAFPALLWLLALPTFALEAGSAAAVSTTVAPATAFLTWLGALVATLWRRVEKVKPSGEKVTRFRRHTDALEQAVGTSLVQRLIVWSILAVVAFVFLELLAWAATSSVTVAPLLTVRWWVYWLAPVIVLVLGWLLLDQTWVSLHPFYRRRLASAFAVRRVLAPNGVTIAAAYDETEMSWLHTHAQRHDEKFLR